MAASVLHADIPQRSRTRDCVLGPLALFAACPAGQTATCKGSGCEHLARRRLHLRPPIYPVPLETENQSDRTLPRCLRADGGKRSDVLKVGDRPLTESQAEDGLAFPNRALRSLHRGDTLETDYN